MVIYCDMDGVLTNFDESFIKVFGVSPNKGFDELGEDYIWKEIDKTKGFWKDMNWQPGGKKLWNYIKDRNTKLLTTPAKSVKDCKEDKRSWAKNELGDVKVIFSNNKEDYASPDAILIDDNKDNIESFKKAGGLAILHTSTETTIASLNKLLSKKANMLPSTGISNELVEQLLSEFEENSTRLGGQGDYILNYTIISKEILHNLLINVTQDPNIEPSPENITELLSTFIPEIPHFEVAINPYMGVAIINYVVKG